MVQRSSLSGRPSPAKRRAHSPRHAPKMRLPLPPEEDEKYSYLGPQRRWPFVWLFLSQACLIYAFARVMLHSVDTSLGLPFLTLTIPPALVNLWLRLKRRRVTLEGHVVLVEEWRASRSVFPSVDVLLPSCGEPLAVLDNTFAHVAALEWDGPLNFYVLDDAHSDEIRELAEYYGFQYLARPNRGEWKKAGNLIHGFENSGSEFIAVFDADFVPRSDFLWETVPYMQFETTGIVQTAQYFDVDNNLGYIARYAGTLQDLFFRWIQPARDTCEAAICAGTNVVYRRAAVVAAGGFAKVPLGEDVHSGVKIWVANYRTRYLPLVLAKGLAPDTWDALTNQQYRWCRSSMLLMISSFFRDAPFSFRQRVCFWAAFLYYMASAAVCLTSVLPTLLVIWFFPTEIHPGSYLIMIPSVISTLVVFPLVARGWRPTIYRVNTVNGFCHLLAVVDALQNKVQAWVPTGAVVKAKSGSIPKRVALIARVWFVLTQSLLWAGLARAVQTGASPWLLWPAAVLAAVQFAMLAPLLLKLGPAAPDQLAMPYRLRSVPAAYEAEQVA
jgi:cellulose synthase (UDP-forming)